MKTIGVIGGMSAESTILYYQRINQEVNRLLGGHHSGKILIDSVDFQPVVDLQRSGDWLEAGKLLASSAKRLEMAGADYIILATNTMHKVADAIEQEISIPFLHIVDAMASKLKAAGIQRAGLLGTKFTMSDGFYTDRMSANGIDVIVPQPEDQDIVHQIIFEELCHNVIHERSRQQYLHVIEDLHRRGAEAVILGCTEIGLLLKQTDSFLPLFDSAMIHADAAVDAIWE